MTVNPIFLMVLYFSDLETNQNLTAIILASKDNIPKIYNVKLKQLFASPRTNLLASLSCFQNWQ